MIRCRDRGGAIPHLRVHQPEKGYRFSIDSVLLADFAAPYCGRSALDLGTGSGVVLLLLACRNDVLRKGVGVEIQPQLWEFACRNIGENGFGGRLSAVLGDFRDDIPGLSPRSVDLVVSNPPYRKIGEGRRNPDPRKDPCPRGAGSRWSAPRTAFRRCSPWASPQASGRRPSGSSTRTPTCRRTACWWREAGERRRSPPSCPPWSSIRPGGSTIRKSSGSSRVFSGGRKKAPGSPATRDPFP